MRVPASLLLAFSLTGSIVFLPGTSAAQSGPVGKIRTVYFTNGLKFDLPAGWRWSQLSGGSVTLYHGVDDKAFAKENRTRFTLSVRLSRDDDTGKSYERLDRQGKQAFPGGTEVEWYAGPRYRGVHYGFSAQISNRYRYLNMVILDAPQPVFSVAAVEMAVLDIARSLRSADSHQAIFHPSGLRADLANSQWFSQSSESGIRFGCFQTYCGNTSNTWMFAYGSSVRFQSDELAVKDITDHFRKQKQEIGPLQRLAVEGGVVLWTEQPGSTWPFLGVVRRDGRYFFVSSQDSGTGRYGVDRLRPHFLHLATSLRGWDGK